MVQVGVNCVIDAVPTDLWARAARSKRRCHLTRDKPKFRLACHVTSRHDTFDVSSASRRAPPHLHLTTYKVMVVVWRLRGNIIVTVLYIANVLPLQWAQLTKTVHTARLGLEFVFLCFFRLHDLSLYWCMFCFTLDS